MQTFISEALDDILKTVTTFEDVVFILPSQRAKVFVKQSFKDKINVGFLPEIWNVEQFIHAVSGIEKVDNIQLLFHFYDIYKKAEKDPVTFDVFASWAITVLQDFNEIDQHLVDTKGIFIYLRDIQRLKKWSVKGEFQETALMKDHYDFLEQLNTYYNHLSAFLKSKNIGYQGLIYREACAEIESFLEKNRKKKFFFIGFNALNKAEEYLFQKVLETEDSEIYWDIDQAFFNSNHQAGKFIRKYKNEWKYYEKNDLKIIGNNFKKDKHIEVIGASKNITQVKYAGEILDKFNSYGNTALVLADETLLPVTLNSMPKKINGINITMGYPLKDLPTTNLIFSIFQLFETQEKLQKSEINQFYYKDIIRFFKHQSVYKFTPEVDEFSEQIGKNNETFISKNRIISILNNKRDLVKSTLSAIFDSFSTIDNFLQRLLNLIDLLKEEVNDLEKEYLFRFHTIFNQLKSLQQDYGNFSDLKTLMLFFRQLITSESLSFQGEPLKGLQLMGMLETRVLDFENIVLISTNEGVLPANSQHSSFIPFDVKLAFELPTYREKDAIFSYHFFRLLQRAKNIFILYNTEHDVFGSGEKSRFVTQLEMMRDDIHQKTVAPKVTTEQVVGKEIQKNEIILEGLKNLAEKGISPSALTNYLYNPMAFYKQKILKIKEFDDVEETVAFNTLGTVVHNTLDELYQPIIGRFLSVEDVAEMEKKVKFLINKYFKEAFKNGDLSTGKNRLIFEVANKFVSNFLAKEKVLVGNSENRLKIIATEENLKAYINIKGLDFPIKLHGQVDRVDELNGVVRIIDYKSGMVKSTELRVLETEELREKEQYKAIQVLLYAFCYTQSKNFDFSKSIQAGIYSFKNLNSGFLPVNFSSNYRKPNLEITAEKLEAFIAEIKRYISEIYNLEIPFIEPTNLKY